MTNLFRELSMSQTPQPSEAKAFVRDAAQKGYRLTVRDFFRFAESVKGRDMGQMVQELRDSGEIDENTFQQLRQKASGFLNLIKLCK